MRRIKFEHIFSMSVLFILGGALFGAYMIEDKDLINMLLVALVGALSSITAFFFTKHKPGGKD